MTAIVKLNIINIKPSICTLDNANIPAINSNIQNISQSSNETTGSCPSYNNHNPQVSHSKQQSISSITSKTSL